MISAGVRPTLVPMHSIDDGINAVRATLPSCWFAEDECSIGIRHLKAYRKDWDEARGCWKDKPRHDQSSHCADAFRYLAMAWRAVGPEVVPAKTQKEIIAEMCKPKSLNEWWDEYVSERVERGSFRLPHFRLNKRRIKLEQGRKRFWHDRLLEGNRRGRIRIHLRRRRLR
jgi:hypothetical protein